jgi:hypothetical protein
VVGLLLVVFAVLCAVRLLALEPLDNPAPPTTTASRAATHPPLTDLSELQLEQVLVRLGDLPAGWRESHPPGGAVGLDADEFCGEHPYADTLQEVNASFTGGPGATFNGQPYGALNLYSSVGLFASPQDASAFLSQLNALVGACRAWKMQRAPGQPPVDAEISQRRVLQLGDEALRVVVGGAPPEVDFVFIRVGPLVGLVAYSVQDVGVAGLEHVDTGFTDPLAETIARGLANLARQP